MPEEAIGADASGAQTAVVPRRSADASQWQSAAVPAAQSAAAFSGDRPGQSARLVGLIGGVALPCCA